MSNGVDPMVRPTLILQDHLDILIHFFVEHWLEASEEIRDRVPYTLVVHINDDMEIIDNKNKIVARVENVAGAITCVWMRSVTDARGVDLASRALKERAAVG
jgi:GMP synthase PP-ATPase subunit